ncbi:DegT/DnrJ/EryC1/StrS family aminotransferase [Candidatus Kirkpatrickella diaphorinae]|uniref:DegT/DnrJ/EryC1/StrS family aminotransferase n=1 Tax=Candidatus Kirkpatrickella diaphorinae TaxID=2984322 RepID=A0ABY6GKP3_9PROT|nr:DegT/DnrJ/EryC1/StrS family aminotransferase [Candidatus Kirkpatrickella diaphorinae]UYH52106.1 DegT/DnrJ/EryC1/StrS family aminotransferase [Candidatus Kirkpatrickella diaphorinae]
MTQRREIAFLDLPRQRARLGEALTRRVDAVMAHCKFVLGPEVTELEERLAAYAGARHAIGVSSGTDALLAVLMGEGIGPGDAVFLPAFTYTATAEIVLLLGAVPVFVDVDARTFQIDPAHLEARIAATLRDGQWRPRAIIGVDLFGQPAPWDELKIIADRHKLTLVDDCAQAFGGSYKGRKLGREARATTLSFFPSKPLGGYGDGGAILTDDEGLASLYRSLRSHGEGQNRYDVQRIGLNARLDTLQAAVLLAKLDAFDAELARREAIARAYDAGLPEIIQTPQRVAGAQSAWAIYSILLPTMALRDSLQSWLKAHGIPSVVYYPKPLHRQPAYASYHNNEIPLPVSEKLGEIILSLPLHPELTDDEVRYIIDTTLEWSKERKT